MPVIRAHRARSTAAILLLSTAACTTPSFDAPPPLPGDLSAAEPMAPMAPSRLGVPVRYDLAPALAWLEEQVPRKIGNIDERLAVPDNDRVHVAFAIARQPFQMSIEGNTATISSVIQYEGKGWYNPPLLPEVSASCGSGDQRPRARLTMRVTVQVTNRWTLSSRSSASAQALTKTERDQCQVTLLHIDVTDKVLAAAKGALETELAKVDREVRRFPLRSAAEGVWDDMQQPLKLTDSLWLLIYPVSVRFLAPTLAGDTLLWQAGLEAIPRVVGGAQPAATTLPLLPPDRSAQPPSTLLIRSQGWLPYDVAESILSKALQGKKIHIGGRTLVVQHLRPIPLGEGRVAIGLTVTGAAKGTLYAVGHPQIDSTGRLTMPDLTLDAGTTGAMTGALAWLASADAIQAFLRDAISVDLGPTIEEGRLLAQKNMNRDLAPGIRLRTTLPSAIPIGVWAGPTALVAQVVVHGEGAIDVNLYPPADSTK